MRLMVWMGLMVGWLGLYYEHWPDGGDAPKRNLYNEVSGELKAKLELTPDVLAAETRYRPQYGALEQDQLRAALFGGPEQTVTRSEPYWDTETIMVPKITGKGSARRVVNVPVTQRVQRWREVNQTIPGSPGAVGLYEQMAPGQADILRQLTGQIGDELELGATLDPSLRREVQQSVRAAQQARGFGLGRGDVADEALFMGTKAEELRRARQAAAMQLLGVSQDVYTGPVLTLANRLMTGAHPQLFGSSVDVNDLFSSNFNAQAAQQIADQNTRTAALTMGGTAAAGLGAAAIIA